MLQMYNMLHMIMMESGIVKQEQAKDKIELVLKTTMNLQNTLVNLSMRNQWDFKSIV